MRGIGVILLILNEVRHLPVNVEFLQDDVVDAHPECAVGAGLYRHPKVGILRDLGIVRSHDYELGAAVTEFADKVAVRGSRPVGGGTEHDHVSGVIPVRALANVRLLAPDFGG